jgi:hypothetical protein
MIADVQRSTRAIEEGRCKDVNMVGAASLTAVLNTYGDIEVLFVFGGDGGTLVVPGSFMAAPIDPIDSVRLAFSPHCAPSVNVVGRKPCRS